MQKRTQQHFRSGCGIPDPLGPSCSSLGCAGHLLGSIFCSFRGRGIGGLADLLAGSWLLAGTSAIALAGLALLPRAIGAQLFRSTGYLWAYASTAVVSACPRASIGGVTPLGSMSPPWCRFELLRRFRWRWPRGIAYRRLGVLSQNSARASDVAKTAFAIFRSDGPVQHRDISACPEFNSEAKTLSVKNRWRNGRKGEVHR